MFWPCQLSHGTVALTTRDDKGLCSVKLACGLEYMSALGFHMYDVGAGFPISKMKLILAKLTPARVKSLAGNGMHLTALAAFVFYIISNLTPVTDRNTLWVETPDGSWDALPEDSLGKD